MNEQSTGQTVREAARSGARKAAAYGMGLPHPLAAGNYSATESVLDTHPELAGPVSAQILAENSAANAPHDWARLVELAGRQA